VHLDGIHYDITKTMSYDKLYSMVLSGRGLGKTTGFLDWAVSDFLKNGSQFVFSRRTERVTDKIKSKIFDNVKPFYPDHSFKCIGNDLFIDDKIAGCAVPLSTSTKLKGVPLPDVNKILYDEALIDKKNEHYLKNEPGDFIDLCETIFRTREHWRAFMFANSITETNPWFFEFNFRLPYNTNVYIPKLPNGLPDDCMLELAYNEKFVDMKNNTRHGRFIKNRPNYYRYAVENKMLLDSQTFIEKKTGDCQFYFGFKHNSNTYGVWVNWNEGKMWVSHDVDPFNKIIYTLTLDDHTPNTLLISTLSRSQLFKSFVDAYKIGRVYFEDMNIKNTVYEVIKMILN